MALKNRRQFLTLALGAGGLAALGIRPWGPWGSASSNPAVSALLPEALGSGGLQLASRQSRALGTEVSILALHASQRVAQAGIAAAFDELELVEDVMSLYRPQSQLCRLNRDGSLEQPHPYLLEVLRAAQEFSTQSDGAFDVTVQPLWELYWQAHKAGRLPEDRAIEAARQKVGWRKLELSAKRIQLTEPGMALTLNGIAQGYAADRVLAVLQARGISHALVNTGEVGAMGRKADGQPWKVGIQHPRRPDAFLEVAALEGRCLSTSGDYATSFTPDHVYNHIFDPATGRSPGEFSSVTVVAQRGTDADALSTALFVAGLQRGEALVQRTQGAEALFTRKDGSTLATQGFPKAS